MRIQYDRGGRLAVVVGFCAGVLVGCGDDGESPPAGTGGSQNGGATGGNPSSGGDAATGGVESSGGEPSSGGAASGGEPSSGGAGGSSGGSSSGGASTGGASTGGASTGGTGTGGAGTGGSGTGGTDTTPSVAGPATTTPDGVLTSIKGATFTKTSGTLVITTLHAVIENLTSFSSIQFWGDVENRGTKLECIPLATLAIDGYDILAVAEGPTYDNGFSTVSSACLPPGGKGVVHGIDNEVSATLLSSPNAVTYSFETLVSTTAVPHPSLPTLTGLSVTSASGLYALSGTLVGSSQPVYNLGIDVFIRDSSGLLRAEKNAFPGDLGTILPGSQTPFKTNGDTNPFSRYVYFIDFIKGPKTNFVNPVEGLAAERKRLVAQRFDDAASARKAIRR